MEHQTTNYPIDVTQMCIVVMRCWMLRFASSYPSLPFPLYRLVLVSLFCYSFCFNCYRFAFYLR